MCQTGDVRLVNDSLPEGSSPSEGRVEVCISGIWGTICDNEWDSNDASIICRQLGFSRFHAVAYSMATFMQGTGPIFLNNVNCTGTETGILSCIASPNPAGSCSHSNDAGVGCKTETLCFDGQTRLVGGSNQYEGRVEICYNETWGTICDGLWSTNDANVVCRQLGYAATGAVPYVDSFFGQGSGPIYYDDFVCLGTESNILNCSNGGLNTIDGCRGHLDDAGVRCNQGCMHGDIRLANGSTLSQGRVEVCLNGVWGTVCDDLWGNTDAQVVCNQLGYAPSGASAVSFAFYGEGMGPIHLDDVQCTGSETRLVSCAYSPIDNCGHLEDAGVMCQGCVTGDIRLIGGMGNYEGRVEVCRGNVWGTVCDDEWDNLDANVVCRQAGYSRFGAIARVGAFFGAGRGGVFLDDVACDGTELRITDCMASPTHNCIHNEDAGVTCNSTLVCMTGSVRLVGGSERYEGRVEVCIDEVWGTVCDDSWNSMDAGVVCSQLGYSRLNAVALPGGTFGQGTGPIYVDNAACTGTETRLLACNYDSQTSDCSHSEDAGIRCSIDPLFCETGDIRLVGGATNREGRVEICVNETWGTVCDRMWNTQDANVACRQLGYQPTNSTPIYDGQFGSGSGRIWLSDLICQGREGRLIDCPNGGIGVSDGCNGHGDDAGLICQEGCVNGQVRLIGGRLASEGRVEVCLDQQWGTVCDDIFDNTDASIVCRQLGYSRFRATAFSNARFGSGTGPIHLDNVGCTGMESAITDCTFDSDTSDCRHFEDASVNCTVDLLCDDGALRLVGGTSDTEGRVEICINETWGTICDDGWTNIDAQVACRNLGFSYMGAIAVTRAGFGQGTGPILLDDVACTGDELNLLGCSSNTQHNCQHTEDAGVRCNPTPECQDGDIRLVDGPSGRNYSGRVEVCIRESWGTVCDDNWSQIDANVACRQLGYSRFNSIARTNAFYGQGTAGINIDEAACTGSERRLIDCPFDGSHDCTHSEDAGVDCSIIFVCQEGSVRLVDGGLPTRGRVELCINETWSTICDNRWSTTDANVVCGQLGFLNQGSTVFPGAAFGPGAGPIAFNNLACTGAERSIFDCANDGYGTIGSCTHDNDASASCLEGCVNGALRLVDGNNQYEGRLEICINNLWGTVCDNRWDATDASVACKQLGYSEHNATALIGATFNEGRGPIHLVNLDCTGSEDALANCSYTTDVTRCTHLQDAALRCSACTSGELRLAGGSAPNNGRVEVCHNQQWGTVCDNGWESVDANVACRQLGFSGLNAVAFTDARFGQGSGPILLEQVQCTGSELNLSECPASINPSCTHREDAGVSCSLNIVCREGDVRLVGSRNSNEGRVEVCRLEQWRSICGNGWDEADASVVCRQLGFSSRNPIFNSTFGPGTGDIYGQLLVCTGTEERLVDCAYNSDPSGCTHTNDIGVTCRVDFLCQNGELRLQGGTAPRTGRLEVCYNEAWGAVCDSNWEKVDADVACRQLGFAPIGTIPNVDYGMTSGTFLNNVQCIGTEPTLNDCMSDTLGSPQTCSGQATLMCQERCESGSLRLVGGNIPWVGRVEVCKTQSWGTVCDMLWNQEDSDVACRQAGYSGQESTPLSGSASTYGPGTGLIHLAGLECTGDESSLFMCDNDLSIQCTHSQDAAVMCEPRRICEDGELRLAGPTATLVSGRVEICFDETWGTICDNFWTSNDGNVACRQLGLSKFGAIIQRNSFFGNGKGPIYLGGLQCSGVELRLTECMNGSTTACTHQTDAGVVCQNKICANGDVRLVGGSNMYEGRVEMCYDETYGTICDIGFGRLEAAVVCSQFGFSRSRVTAISDAFFGVGTGLVLLSDLSCRGNETNLLDCSYPGSIGASNCAHSLDVSVVCERRRTEPVQVAAFSPSNDAMNVTWAQPLEFESSINNYLVTCNTSQGATRPVKTRTPDERGVLIVDLQPYTQYNCCVQALYSDASENAYSCALATTLQGPPGPPANLSVTYNPQRCSDVSLTWDPPAANERNGIIRGYRVRITITSTGEDFSRDSNFNSLNLNGLDCCSTYIFTVTATTIDYGTASQERTFRTMPDLSAPLVVDVAPVNNTALRVSWTVPMAVHNQGFESLAVNIQSECFTGANLMVPQIFTITDNATSEIIVGSLDSFVPYRVRVVATICSNTINVYNNTDFTRQAAIEAPAITTVLRFGPTSASIEFNIPLSEEAELDHFEVNLYDSTTGSRSLDLLVGPTQTFTTPDSSLLINTLSICQAYWVTTTAVNCGSSVRSDPAFIDVNDPSAFSATIDIGVNGPCSIWVTVDTEQKHMDAQNFIIEALNDACSLSVPCTANNTFSCIANDLSKVTLIAILVSTESVSAEEQVSCLNEWTTGGGSSGREVTIGGISSRIISVESTDAPGTQSPGGAGLSISGWVWAVVAIAVVGFIIVILLVIIILVVRRRDKPRDTFHEQMLDDMDDVHSTHSIGVVENPLFAEQDGPMYSDLQKKEHEDVDFGMKAEDLSSPEKEELAYTVEFTKDDF